MWGLGHKYVTVGFLDVGLCLCGGAFGVEYWEGFDHGDSVEGVWPHMLCERLVLVSRSLRV